MCPLVPFPMILSLKRRKSQQASGINMHRELDAENSSHLSPYKSMVSCSNLDMIGSMLAQRRCTRAMAKAA